MITAEPTFATGGECLLGVSLRLRVFADWSASVRACDERNPDGCAPVSSRQDAKSQKDGKVI